MLNVTHPTVILISMFIPLLAAAAAHKDDSSRYRAAVAFAASAVLTVAQWIIGQEGTGIPFADLATTLGTAFFTQLAAYLGVWQHWNINTRILPTLGLRTPA